MDTRTAVWVSTAENFLKSLWEKLRIFLESLGGSQHQLCIKTWPLLTVGILLLRVELFYLQLTVLAFLVAIGAFLLTVLAFLLTVGAFLLTVGK